MINSVLSPDTQAILLLCASFGQNRLSYPQPLALSEYNILADWLQENQMRPGDLLSSTVKNQLQKIPLDKLDPHRIEALLERGVMLSLAVEKWTTQGLWILGRGDSQYPKRLKQRLKQKSPPILYGIGNIELLLAGGLAIVGSRDINEKEIDYTQKVAKTCAKEGIQVISGGARGVDQASMLAALEASGTAVGVLADSLIKTAVNGKYRSSISEGRLALISPYDPHAGFNTGNAMGRNKYIYALADYALVVSSSYEKGGTWAGATEALEKIKDVPVFVRIQEAVPEGNRQLVKQGAKPFIPASSIKGRLGTLLEATTKEVEPRNTLKLWPSLDLIAEQLDLIADMTAEISVEKLKKVEDIKNNVPKQLLRPSVQEVIVNSQDMEDSISSEPDLEVKQDESACLINENIPQASPTIPIPKDIYEAVLPFILAHLDRPLDVKSISEGLKVRQGQMQDWLNRAVAEGKVIKTKKPVAYVINRQAAQLSLLSEAE